MASRLRVIAPMAARDLAVRVDQDSRPDLSNRYEDYGWPATIVFDSKGNELAKRAGYIPPIPMASMLEAAARRLKMVRTWNSLARIATETEEALLQEVVEWHSFRQFTGEPH